MPSDLSAHIPVVVTPPAVITTEHLRDLYLAQQVAHDFAAPSDPKKWQEAEDCTGTICTRLREIHALLESLLPGGTHQISDKRTQVVMQRADLAKARELFAQLTGEEAKDNERLRQISRWLGVSEGENNLRHVVDEIRRLDPDAYTQPDD